MEEWQRKHIQKNLVQLVKDTTCHAQLVAGLLSAQLLHEEEAQLLDRPHLTPFEKAKHMYDILQTRPGSYDVIREVLKENNQSGAYKILTDCNQLFKNYGSISFDKNHLLGSGCFGTKVYKGEFGGKEIAVKVLNSDCIEQELVEREVNFLKQLGSHENIVQYHTVVINENFIYLALELCLINLQDEMEMKLVNIPPATILFKCTKGLAHLHKHNVIHSDLKPANILLNHGEQVKISDFGLSKRIPIGATSISVHSVVGTAEWMAPEVSTKPTHGQTIQDAQSVRMSMSADVFSLGCIFYFVLTNGMHPFGGDAVDRQYNIRHNKSQIDASRVDRKWQNTVKNMIAHSPGQRPTVDEVLLQGLFSIQHTFQPFQPKVKNQRNACVDITAEEMLRMEPFEEIERLLQTTHIESVRPSNMIIYGTDYNSLKEAIEKHFEINLIKSFIEDNLDKNLWLLKGEKETNLLHTSVACGHLDAIKYFLSLGIDISSRDSEDRTPIHYVGKGSFNIIAVTKLILENGGDIFAIDNLGCTVAHLIPLANVTVRTYRQWVHYIIKQGHESIFHVRDGKLKSTAFYNAVAAIDVDRTTMELMLQNSKVDVNEKTLKYGTNALLIALRGGRNMETLKNIVELGGDIRSIDDDSNTVLHYSVEVGNAEALNYFISLGCNVQLRNKKGFTPLDILHHAQKNFVTLTKLLLEKGAIANSWDVLGCNVAHRFACNKQISPQDYHEWVSYMVSSGHGSMFFTKGHTGDTPINFALHQLDVEKKTIQLLISECGIDINERRPDGETILQHGAKLMQWGKKKLEPLVELGADWHSVNDKGSGIIHSCVEGGNLEALQYFISLGADVNVKNADGESPIHQIKHSKIHVVEIIKILMVNGANYNTVDKSNATVDDLVKQSVSEEEYKKWQEWVNNFEVMKLATNLYAQLNQKY